MNNSFKFCLYCGTPLPSDALFCSSCGRAQGAVSQPSRAVSQPSQAVSPAGAYYAPRKPRAKIKALSIVKAFLLLLVSIALIATSFLPIISTEVKIDEKNSLSLKLSPIEVCGFFFDSFDSLTEKEVNEESAKLEEKSLDIMKDVITDTKFEDGKISEQTKSDFVDLTLDLISIAYRHKDTSAPAVMWAAVIIYFLYLAICAALLICSIIYLVLAFALPDKCEKVYRGAISLLCAAPMLIASLFFAASSSLEPPLGAIAASGKIPAGFLVSIIIACSAVLCFVIINLIASRKIRKTHAFPRIIAAFVCVLVAVSVFLPAMTTSVRVSFAEDQSNEKTTVVFSHGAGFFTNFHIGDEETKTYKEFTKSSEARKEGLDALYEGLSLYTEEEANDGTINPAITEYIMYVSAVYKLYNNWWIFALVPLVYLLVLLCVGVILWLNLSDLSGGIYSSVASLIFKILAVLFALCALGAVITFVLLEQFYIKEMELTKRFACGIGYGIIIMASLAAANVFVPARRFFKREPAPLAPPPQSDPAISVVHEAPVAEEKPTQPETSAAEEEPIESEATPVAEEEPIESEAAPVAEEEPIESEASVVEEESCSPEAPKVKNFCPNCGAKYSGEPAFCNECGVKLKK